MEKTTKAWTSVVGSVKTTKASADDESFGPLLRQAWASVVGSKASKRRPATGLGVGNGVFPWRWWVAAVVGGGGG